MIREYRDSDAPAVVALLRETFPQWVNTVAGFRHRLASQPPRARARYFVAEVDGEIAGWASCGFELYTERDDVAYVGIGVRRAWRRRGLGTGLFEHVLAHLVEHGAARLLADGDADEASRRFAEKHGFRHTMTRRLSALDPRSVDPGEFMQLEAQKAREAFRVAPFTELSAEDIFDVDAAASRDIPLDEPMTAFRFEQWNEDHWLHPDLTHEGSFAVLSGGKPVAFAMVRADLDSRRASNDMTGTLRAYRGRGLARLAKLATIVWAAEHRITAIFTENDETNAPMLALNVSLGYRPVASVLAHVRDL